MLLKFLLGLLAVSYVSTSAIEHPPPYPAFGPPGGQPRPSVDPAISGGCFQFYISEQNRISTTYSGDYNECLLTATQSRERLYKEVAEGRRNLVDATSALCGRIKACNSLNDTLQMFQCHSQAGGLNIRTAYDASDNSTQWGSMMAERLRMIDVRVQQCTHAVRRTYISDVGRNYNKLQTCLAPPYLGLGGPMGGRPGRYPPGRYPPVAPPPPPPPPPSTTTTTTAVPPTLPVNTTTTAPSTTTTTSTTTTSTTTAKPTTTTTLPTAPPSSTAAAPASSSSSAAPATDGPTTAVPTTEPPMVEELPTTDQSFVSEMNANLRKQFSNLLSILN